MQDKSIPTPEMTVPLSDESPAPRPRSSKLVVGALVTASLGAASVFVGVAAARASAQAMDTLHIAPGVKIAGVPVGGMTEGEAVGKVRAWAQSEMRKPVTLIAPVSGKKWNLTVAEAGGRYDLAPAVAQALQVGKDDSLWERVVNGGRERDVDIPVTFLFNEAQLVKHLDAIGKTVYKPARNARARLDAAGNILIAEYEHKGVKLDAGATKAALLKNGPEALRDGEQAKLVIVEEPAKVTASDLGKIGTQLAAFNTGYSSSSTSRRHNVELAARRIHGTLLAPGEIFSYNDIVGPRELRLGWRNAPTYQDGQVVPGPGGGVCQVSTTLYNAVLRANLKIVQRQHHSMPVHYVNPGCDATVVYGYIDFKFQNNTDGPILISSRSGGGRLSFEVFGKEPSEPKKVEVVSGPRRTNRSGGVTVTTYKVIEHGDGTKTREVLSTDSYRPMGARRSAAPRRRSNVAGTRRSTPAPAKPSTAPATAAAATSPV